jgi:hypothetical protein
VKSRNCRLSTAHAAIKCDFHRDINQNLVQVLYLFIISRGLYRNLGLLRISLSRSDGTGGDRGKRMEKALMLGIPTGSGEEETAERERKRERGREPRREDAGRF